MVTTATDVYALGVLLYSLLTGRHPTGAGSRTSAEHLHALLEGEPVRASEAVMLSTGPTDDVDARATRRGSTAKRLHRLYRGDIDNILGKTLKKQSAERYPSVTALADDVRRYLNDEPISVKRDAWSYRAAKFLRRHKAGTAAAAIIVTILLTSTVVTIQLMLEARRQRDEAQFQTRRAQASSEFMRYLVTQIGTTPMTMKEVLDRGRVALEQQYGGDPAFVARMLVQLSGPYIDLGEYATSAKMMARALEIATKLDDADLLASTHCGAGVDAVETRDFDGARAHLAEGRRHVSRLETPAVGLLVGCAVGETRLAFSEGRFEDAVGHATRAVELLEKDGNTSTTRYTSALSNLVNAYGGARNYRGMVRVERKIREITKRIGRDRTLPVVVSLNNQGVAERALGWWLTSERTSLEAIDIARGLDASGRLPAYLTLNYGRLLVALGRHAEGADWLRRTFEHADASPRFHNLARLHLASLLLDQGQLGEARALFDEAERAMGGVLLPNERPSVLILRSRFALAEGRPDQARAHLAEGLNVEGYPSRLSPVVHEYLENASRLALETGDVDAAVRLAGDAVKACDLHFGTDEPSANTGRARLTLGLALLAKGRSTEARAELERAAVLIERVAGADHPWAREARAKLAQMPPA